MSKNYTVMELEAIKHLCKCVNSVASLPADLIADTNVATNTTYSSYKIDAEMSALENDIQRYVDTALAGLNKLSKEVIDDKALVVKENVLYLYKDPLGTSNDYMQMMLINGVAVELGSTTCDFSSVYSKDEVDDKFALKIDLDTLTTSFNDLVTSVEKKIDKDKIVTVLDDTVTDDEVPSAKAVNDILSTVTGITNAKTYCLLSQLGITTPCTIKDIWDKMPSGSVAIVDADSSIVTDLDVIRIALGISDGDEVYGILTVVKLEQRTTLEFRRARTNRAMIPDTFIGYCKGSDCTLIQWRKDVDLTDINTKLTQLETVLNKKADMDKAVKKIYITDRSSEDARQLIQNHWNEFATCEFYNLRLDTSKWAWNAEIYKDEQEFGTVLLMTYGIDIPNIFYGKLYSGVWYWRELYSTGATEVGVTTITPVNSSITGNIEYEVKNGICYVSMKDVNSTTNANDLSISTTMPKSSINCGCPLIGKGSKGNVAFIYIDKNTTKLNGNFWLSGVSGNCSFSYPVAE